jgi:Mrp family chromosome partitioning ATPase
LKVRLTLAAARSDLRSLLLISAVPGEGVTTVTLGLATAMAEGAQRGVLVVDCNVAAPSLGERLGFGAVAWTWPRPARSASSTRC